MEPVIINVPSGGTREWRINQAVIQYAFSNEWRDLIGREIIIISVNDPGEEPIVLSSEDFLKRLKV